MTATSPNAVAPAAHNLSGQGHAPYHGHSHHASAHRTPAHHTPAHHVAASHANGTFTTTFHGVIARAETHQGGGAPAISDEVTQALRAAMEREGVPTTWEDGLQFIVGHESSGQVGVSNKHDSARGLFQLTRASYELNPNGAKSFGNAVEEAQGGIRYIKQRYQTADNAVQFWQRHRYY